MRTRSAAGLLLAIFASATTTAMGWRSHADDQEIKTVTKKVPAYRPAPAEMPVVKSDPSDKWTIESKWEGYSDEGCYAEMYAPETAAYFTARIARSKLMDDKETRKEWSDMVRVMLEDKITFTGAVTVRSSSANSDWTFYLYREDGTRVKPKIFNVRDATYGYTRFGARRKWYRNFTVTFDTIDPTTKNPFLTPATKYVTLGIGGTRGQVKFRYEFQVDKPGDEDKKKPEIGR